MCVCVRARVCVHAWICVGVRAHMYVRVRVWKQFHFANAANATLCRHLNLSRVSDYQYHLEPNSISNRMEFLCVLANVSCDISHCTRMLYLFVL
jgi:hypothetical protein